MRVNRARTWAILSSILSVGAMTLIVKGAAFAKEIVAARQFGASDQMDAFLIAWLLPSLIPQVFAQGMPDALLPAYAELRESEGCEAADQLAVRGVQSYAAALAVIMAVLSVSSGWIVPLLTAKFAPAKQFLTLDLLRSLVPFGFIYGLSFIFTAWLHANKRFLLAAVAPAAVPVCTLAAMLLEWEDTVHAMVHGATAGACILTLLLARACLKGSTVRLFQRPRLDPQTKRMLLDALPLLAGGVLMCGMPVVDKIMAGLLPQTGNVAVLEFSEKICAIVLTLAAGSAAQVLFPWIAEQAGKRDWRGMRRMVHRSILWIGITSLVIVAGFWISAPQVVSLLFEGGEFGKGDTERVAAVLRFSAIQIPFYIAAVIASKVVNSLRAGGFMLVTTVVNLAANIVLNIFLSRWFGVPGLALATAIVYAFSALMLLVWIEREVKRRTARDAVPQPV